jgi:aminoglycoside phosphotransferase family enzyme/predicted kinase
MSADILQPLSLIHGLMQPDIYDPPVEKCILIETHISWVILAGSYAYKIKKSLNLGFLDFTTLAKRFFYCQEELRLNKRLAPSTYLSVVPITGTFTKPQWGDEGAGEDSAIEFAIKMQAFPQQAQLDRVLAAGALHAVHIDILARHIANFHMQIEKADSKSSFGAPQMIRRPVEENFIQIRQHVQDLEALRRIDELEQWSQATFQDLLPIFALRKSSGFIRECHGDMHLRNIAWVDDAPLVFDCIEFSPSLRWIDVISDISFLVMDLQERRQPELAQRFLNAYLEYTGDYPGTAVLRFYMVYRALVRAKVDAIRAYQPGIDHQEQEEAERDFLDYLNLALTYIRPAKPVCVITRGMSASGKSTVTRSLLEQIKAIRLRSDTERKRLFGMQPEDDGRSAVGEGIYSASASRRTYQSLEESASRILDAGYSVIVDAVFLHYREREHFRKMAENKKMPLVILECTADIETLRERIVQRKNDVSDADLRVLDMQRSRWQPLRKTERSYSVSVDTGVPPDIGLLVRKIQAQCSRQSGGPYLDWAGATA